MAHSSDRSKISPRPQSSKALSKVNLQVQLSALSISSLEEKLNALAPAGCGRGGRSSQPASPSQILKQALRTGVNSPKFSDSLDQENRPPTSFVFPSGSLSKQVPPTLTKSVPQTPHAVEKSLYPSPSAVLLTPKPPSKTDVHRSSSQKDLSRSDLSRVVTQVKSQGGKGSGKIYKEHLFNTFQAMKFVRRVKEAETRQLATKMVFLPRENFGRKTVVFDLDETLVHCVEDISHAHIAIPITFPSGERIIAGVNIRPFAKECLSTVSTFCEVIVFTASQKCYADQVLDYLDPTHSMIAHRLYRESCVVTDGVFIKDLRILGNRRLQDLIIVDNAAYSFAYQLSNGIPIISWYDDPSDRELFNLVDYLRGLSLLDDIRPVNRETFHLEKFCEDYERDCMKQAG